jgi:hypothetical protein
MSMTDYDEIRLVQRYSSEATYSGLAELKGHVHVIDILKAFVELDNVWMPERLVDFDFGVELWMVECEVRQRAAMKHTFVLAFLVFNDALVTTLMAWWCPRMSLTSYTLANPPSPRRPSRVNMSCLCMSRMTDGGEGGTALLFWRGSGGEACFVASSCGLRGGEVGILDGA